MKIVPDRIGQGRTRVVAENIIGMTLVRGASIIIAFLMVPITIDYVSPELYGVWLTLSSIMTWIGFMDIGFSQGLKNKLTEAISVGDYSKGKGLVSTTYCMMILIFVPVCIILQGLLPFVNWSNLLNIDPSYNEEVRKVMIVLIVFCCLRLILNVLVSIIAAFQKVALSSLFDLIGQFLAFIIIIVLTKTCPPSLLALSFSITAMPLLVLLFASIYLFNTKYKGIAPSFYSIKKAYIKDLFGLGYKFFIINIQVVILYQTTNVLISNISSPLQVTQYNIAYKLLSVVMMAFTIISAPLWPAYTDAYAKSDLAWMKKMKSKLDLLFYFVIVAVILIVLFSQLLYWIWIGDKVEIPYMMTSLVAIYVLAYCRMNINGTLIVGMGKLEVQTYLCIIGMILHIPLSFFLSSYWGVYGVLISLIFFNLLYAVIMNLQVSMLLNRTAKGIWNK